MKFLFWSISLLLYSLFVQADFTYGEGPYFIKLGEQKCQSFAPIAQKIRSSAGHNLQIVDDSGAAVDFFICGPAPTEGFVEFRGGYWSEVLEEMFEHYKCMSLISGKDESLIIYIDPEDAKIDPEGKPLKDKKVACYFSKSR